MKSYDIAGLEVQVEPELVQELVLHIIRANYCQRQSVTSVTLL